jgi:hypothetical protein
MAGTIKASTIQHDQTGSPPVFRDNAGNEIGRFVRTFANFVGSSAATNASLNVSSITRHGTGDWTVSFSTTLVDGSYAFSGGVQYNNTGSKSYQNIIWQMVDGSGLVTSSSIRFSTGILSVSTTYDTAITTVTITR